VGHPGDRLDARIVQRWRAESSEDMAIAKRDVKLDITQRDNTLKFYVDGPFRCRSGCFDRQERNRYHVSFDFDLQVPQDAALELSTVNGGNVSVENAAGDFRVCNVNGGITMDKIYGSGSATTVNGPVSITFARNPERASRFKTVNGELSAYFQPGLAADISVKTFHGGVYTDFDVASLPLVQPLPERQGKRFIYRGASGSRLRIGNAGGPEISFDTLNGNIRILKKG
jgi:hypothetical protein